MLLVSQFNFVYWYDIVLVVLTRSESSVLSMLSACFT